MLLLNMYFFKFVVNCNINREENNENSNDNEKNIVSFEYEKIIQNINKIRKIQPISVKNMDELFQTLIDPCFYQCIILSPDIVGLIEKLSHLFQVFLNSISGSIEGNVFVGINLTKNIRGRVEIKDIIQHVQSFSYQNKYEIVEIWEKIDKLFGNFLDIYGSLLLLQYKLEIHKLSESIKKDIIVIMERLKENGKIDNITLTSEKNDLLFLQIQIAQIEEEIETRKQQAIVSHFNLKDAPLVDTEEINFNNEIISIANFVKNIDLPGNILYKNYIVCDPQDILDCIKFRKMNPIPIDISLESDLSTESNFNCSGSIELSLNKIAQIIYNIKCINKSVKEIAAEMFEKGVHKFEQNKVMLIALQKNIKKINKINETYIQNFKQELVKFEIDNSNLVSVLKYIDGNILKNMLQNDIGIKIYVEKLKHYKHTISIIIVIRFLIKKYKTIIV